MKRRLIVSVMGASLSYCVQGLRGRASMRLVFILFTLAGPVILLLVVSSLYHLIVRRPGRSRD